MTTPSSPTVLSRGKRTTSNNSGTGSGFSSNSLSQSGSRRSPSNAIARLKNVVNSGQLRLSAPAGPFSTSTHPSSIADHDAQQLFDRLAGAVNEEQLGHRIAHLKAATESDPVLLCNIGAIIAHNEYAWLAVMQRVFNDTASDAGSRKQLLASFICDIAARDDVKGLRSVLLATKLSSILTVPGPISHRVVGAILPCVTAAADVDAFFNKMQGFENVEIFAADADVKHLAPLIGTLVGRCPAMAKSMCEHRLDVVLLRKAFASLASLSSKLQAYQMTLYALRFFVRVKGAADLDFAERSLSLCAQTCRALGHHSAELAADITQVIAGSDHVKSHPNILANLYSACGPWCTTATRKLPIATFLAKAITAHPQDQMGVAALKAYKALSNLINPITDGPNGTHAPLELVGTLLHATQCVIRCTPPKYGSKFLNFEQLGQVRLILQTADRNQSIFAATMERWGSILHTLTTRALSCSLSGLVEPWVVLVSSGRLTKEAFQRIVGSPYNEPDALALDAVFDEALRVCIADAKAVLDESLSARQLAEDAEATSRIKIYKRCSAALDEIRKSPKQQYFDRMVLPGCKYIAKRITDAQAAVAAAKQQLASLSSSAVVAGVRVRHKAAVDAIEKLEIGLTNAEDQKHTEPMTLGIFQSIELDATRGRQKWFAKQQLTINEARSNSWGQMKNDPFAFKLFLLELEEETRRGGDSVWFNAVGSVASEQSSRGSTNHPMRRRITGLVFAEDPLTAPPSMSDERKHWNIGRQEEHDRALLLAAFAAGAMPDDADSMCRSLSILSPRFRGSLRSKPMTSVTSVEDIEKILLAEAKLQADPFGALERDEKRGRVRDSEGFVFDVRSSVLQHHEVLQRQALVHLYNRWLDVADAAQESPEALDTVLREALVI